jgi:hypothetical protein
MRGLLALSVILSLVAPSSSFAQEVVATAQETVASATGAKVWLGRYTEYEEYLRTAPIDRLEDVGQGVTKPKKAFFRPGGMAASALVKPLAPKRRQGYWESYKSEVAAYELDRLLGLDMVPVTVERRIAGDRASVQLWLTGCRLLKDVATKTPSRPLEWARQVCRHRVFDALIANIDRNAGNILVDEDWNLILIDHSRAFATDDMPFMDNIDRCDRGLFERLKALDEETLMTRLKPWLFSKGSVRALLSRRDKIVEKLEGLAKERGEIAVFPF